jgi:3,4-dihydroxy 2-butanone 4-phosphate synthase
MNILIPMGGQGLRLRQSGFLIPKPLLEVCGSTMIQKVIESIDIEGNFIYVVRRDHVDNYNIDSILNKIQPGSILILEEDNDGQTQTCLLAEKEINNDEPLLIVNCDNYLVWNKGELTSLMESDSADGAVFTFTDPQKRSHWCFAELNNDKEVARLVEKDPVSDIALAGAFYWRKGSDFVKYAKHMVENNVRAHNGEFYLGSVFNQAIEDGKRIVNVHIPDMKSMGTPEELESFKDWITNKNKLNNPKEQNMINRNVQDAIEALIAGKPIVLVDEHDRENEGDIVIAAEKANEENLVFTMNKARGLMCVPCDGQILDRLEIPPMVENNTDKNQTPFTVSIDAKVTTTGMSVEDRLATISVITSDESSPEDLDRPGHLFPLRPREGLLKDRRGHTEGSIELMILAGLKPIAIICEIMNDDGTMTKGGQINKFATENGLTLVSIEELYEAVYNESL